MTPRETINSIAIVGNGLMGQGIAQVFARSGTDVTIIGRGQDSLARAREAIRGNFDAFVQRELTSRDAADQAISRIATTVDYDSAASADFVIEAVSCRPRDPDRGFQAS